jgi:hypothetical protein
MSRVSTGLLPSTLPHNAGPRPPWWLHGHSRTLITSCLIYFRSHIHCTYSNGSSNVSALPLMCPQPFVDNSTFTEDCMSMILYVPTTLHADSSVPTLMWYVKLSFFGDGDRYMFRQGSWRFFYGRIRHESWSRWICTGACH